MSTTSNPQRSSIQRKLERVERMLKIREFLDGFNTFTEQLEVIRDQDTYTFMILPQNPNFDDVVLMSPETDYYIDLRREKIYFYRDNCDLYFSREDWEWDYYLVP